MRNKLLKTIIATTLGLSMAVGAGVGIANSVKAKPAYAAEVDNLDGTFSDTISEGTLDGSGTDATITWSIGSDNIIIVSHSGGGNAVANTNRLYRYNYVEITALNGYAIVNLKITYSTNYRGANNAGGTAITDNRISAGQANVDVTDTNVSGGVITVTPNSNANTHFFFQNAATGETNTQLRWTEFKINYSKSGGEQPPEPTTYIITYDENVGETGDTVTNMPENGSVNEGSDCTLSTMQPERTGYLFGGWASAPDSDTPITELTNVTSDTTVYAIWIADERTKVSFIASTDSGTSPLTKEDAVFTCSNGVLDNGSEYRLYKDSTTTFSVEGGTIKEIRFKGVSSYPASGFANQDGWTTTGNDGTWTGSSESVSFVASGKQVRATRIDVFYLPPETVQATGMTISPSTAEVYVGDTVTFTPSLTGGIGAYEKTIAWTTTKESVIAKPDNSQAGNSVTVTTLSSGSVTLTGTVIDPGSASANITITVKEPRVLSSIELSGDYPTEFYVGDAFSHEGMTVTAHFSDSTSKNVTSSAVFSGYNMSEDGEQTVTVSYTEDAVTKTATYTIDVYPPRELSSISISGYATELNQYYQFEFGGTVTANYNDASTEDVTASATFSGYDMSVIGEQTVTVSYTEDAVTKTATYTLTVTRTRSVTITYEDVLGLGKSGGGGSVSFTKGPVSLSITNGFGNTSYFHVYKNANMTISSTISMAKIELTDAGDSNPLSGFGSLDGYSDGVWEGESTSVTFTASAKQVHLASFKVTFVSNDPSVTVDKESINLKTYNYAGITVTASTQNIDNPTFEWTKNNDNVVLVEAEHDNEIIIKPNTQVDQATAVVTLTVGGAEPAPDPIEITVTLVAPVDGEIPDKALTVADAIAAIDATAPTYVVQGTVYVKGIISQIDSYDSNHKSITYWISDDGTTTNQFEVYSGKDFGGADFASTSDIQVGSIVIIKGSIKKYGDIYEFNYNNELVCYSSAILHATETDGNIDSASIIFNTKISKDAWNSYGVATEFGMMLYKTKKNTVAAVEDKYNPNLTAAEQTKVLVINNDERFGLTLGDRDSYYSFTVKVTIPDASDYAYKYCVAPYLVSNGEHHFLCNMVWSVNSLAEKGLVDSPLSEEAMNALQA